MGLFWLILIGLAYTMLFRGNDHSRPHGLPYCSSEFGDSIIPNLKNNVIVPNPSEDSIKRDPNCQPCPERGYCSQGKLIECEPPFKIRSAICIEPQEISNHAMEMIYYLQRTLADKAGRCECGVIAENYTLIHDLRKDLQEIFAFKDEELFNNSFEKMKQLVRESSQNFELEIVTVTRVNSEDGTVVTEEAMASTVANLGVVCRTKKLLRENWMGITVILVLAVVAIVGSIIRSQRELYERNMRDVIQTAMNVLRSGKPVLIVHLRDELRNAFESRFEITDALWADVCERMRSDSRIEESDTHKGVQWTWASNVEVSAM